MRRIYPSLLIITVLIIACRDSDKKASNSNTVKELPQNVLNLMDRMKQKPDSVGLRLLLVDALDSLNHYQEALAQMDSLIKKDSLNYGLWYRKAKLNENAKDTNAAIICYNNAIKVYPSPDALLSLANILAETKNANALILCKQVDALKMGREYAAHTNFIKGVYYARTGNKNAAQQSFEECIKNDYTYMVAYMEKGFILFDDKKYSDALKVFETAIQVNNIYADAYYWQGKCYEALNDKTNAINSYKNAFALDKTLKEAIEAIDRLK
jgi:tetratricopeptide (TPR) repeat protein